MRVYVLIAQQTSGIAELPLRVQCCSLCKVVHCTAQCIQHRAGQCSVNIDSNLTHYVLSSCQSIQATLFIYQHIITNQFFKPPQPYFILSILNFQIFIHPKHSSFNTSCFHIYMNGILAPYKISLPPFLVSDVCLILYIAETDVRQL